MSDKQLRGGTAVVTGAASGLGRSIAVSCARAGMQVILADIDEAGSEESATLVRSAGSMARVVPTDVSNAVDMAALADAAFSFGNVTLLINNAGIAVSGRVWDMPLGEWHRALDVNLMGIVHGVHYFVPRMIASGIPGHVVNMASLAGLVSAPGIGGYCATKHAVVGLSECLLHDLRLSRARIGVSVVCPGVVATKMTQEAARLSRRGSAPVTVEDVAAEVIAGVEAGRFYILTHPGSETVVGRRIDAMREGRAPPIARV